MIGHESERRRTLASYWRREKDPKGRESIPMVNSSTVDRGKEAVQVGK